MLRIAHVVELQKVKRLHLQASLRALELGGVRPLKLGGDEEFVTQARLRDDLAQHGLRIAIDRRGVDQAAAPGDQRFQNGRRFLLRGVVIDVEDVSRAEPDGGQEFAATRNRARQRRRVLRSGRKGEHRCASRDGKFAPRLADGHARSPVTASPLHSQP